MSPPSNPLQIRRPCPTPDAPSGDGPILYCATCDAAVIDFAALTPDEAARLQHVDAARGRCGRITVQGAQHVYRTRRPMRGIALALGIGIGGLAVAHAAVGAGGIAPAPGGLEASVAAAIQAAESFGVPRSIATEPAPASVPSDAAPASVPSDAPASEAKKKEPCEELDDGREVIPDGGQKMVLTGGL